MASTFEVSTVEVGKKQIATTGAKKAFAKRTGAGTEASAANQPQLAGSNIHPVIEAAHVAFDEHLPLVLSPDDVWLCIAQAFAHHIDENAEALRGRFVRHAGKAEIVVIRDEFRKGAPDNDWPGVFDEFSDAIAAHVGKQRDLVVADFSTTGAVERAASEVVLMAAMKNYFKYTVLTRCGIPRVTLLGTPADWASIKRRASHLAEYGLEAWIAALSPILDELCAASEGKPNRERWLSFYKFESGSGGDRVTGWINTLFPFVRKRESDGLEPNPSALDWRNGHGTAPTRFPSGLSIAPFVWQYLGTRIPMEFVAGFAGISQREDDLSVRPAIGWAVREARS
jgi:hypothetical protein